MKPVYIIFVVSIIWCYPAFAQLLVPNQMQLAENPTFEEPILTLNDPMVAEPALILNEPGVGEPIFSLDESRFDTAYASDMAAFGEHDDDPAWFNDAMAGESISTLDDLKFGDVAYASDITAFDEYNDDPAWFIDAFNQPSATRSIGDTYAINREDFEKNRCISCHAATGTFWAPIAVTGAVSTGKSKPSGNETGSFWAPPMTAVTVPASKGIIDPGSGNNGKTSENNAGSPTGKTKELLQKGNDFYDKDDEESYASALKYYEMAIDTNPNLAELWFNKGNALYKLGRFKEAVSAYDEAITLNRKFSKAWKNKGFALEALGKTNEAEAAFAKARELESAR